MLVYESGTIGAKPTALPLSIGDGELAETADAVVSVPEMFNYWLQPGRIDVGFLGAAQIDRFANINTTVIGDYDAPEGPAARRRRRAGDRRVLRRGRRDRPPEHARVRRAGRLRHLGRLRRRAAATASGSACAAAARRTVITDLGVLEPDPETCELTLTALHPGVDASTQARAATGWDAARSRDDLPATDRRPTRSWPRCAR